MKTLHEIRNEIRSAKLEFIVYVLHKPDESPFYVGKGNVKRISDHETEARAYKKKGFFRNEIKIQTIHEIWESGNQVGYSIDSWHETEASAKQREKELIALHGRLINDSGILTNITEGGDSPEEMKEYCDKHPEFIDRLQAKKRQWIEEHPDQYAEAERKRLEICNTEEVRSAVSETLKQYYHDNPQALEEMSRKLTKYYEENPERARLLGAVLNTSQFITDWLARVDPEVLAKKAQDHSNFMKQWQVKIKKKFQTVTRSIWDGWRKKGLVTKEMEQEVQEAMKQARDEARDKR